MNITYRVDQQTLSRVSTSEVPRRGSREYLYLTFTFSSDWVDLTKTVFISNGEYSDGIIVEDNVPVQVPMYYTQNPSFSITFVGIRDNEVVPTNVVTLLLEESNEVWEEVAPDPQSVPYQQLIAMVQEALDDMKAPYIDPATHEWMQWDPDSNDYVSSGVIADSAIYSQQAQDAATAAAASKNAASASEAQSEVYAQQAKNAAETAMSYASTYGVRFEGGSNTGATVTRLYGAVGLVAQVGVDDTVVQNDFDNIYPWSARRRCCGYWNENNDFVVNAYEGEPGYITDGSNGDVWVEHSLFYYKHTFEESGAEEILISGTPAAGFEPAPIFRNGDGAPRQKAYTAAYPMGLVDNLPVTRAGVYTVNLSMNDFMARCRDLGPNYCTTQVAERYTEYLYMFVEFATRNLQSLMQGYTSLPYNAAYTAQIAETSVNRIAVTPTQANAFPIDCTIGIGTSLGGVNIAKNRQVTSIEAVDGSRSFVYFDGDPVNIAVGNIIYCTSAKTGVCDNVVASSGSVVSNTDGKHQCIYRGMESPWANAFEIISDLLLKREGVGGSYTYDIYYLPDVTKFNNSTITDDYVKLNYQLPTTDGYVKSLGQDSRYPWVRCPNATGASTTTYYSDYYYYPRYDICAARLGGSWNYGSYSGPAFWICYYTPGTAVLNYRARLSFFKPID